MSIPNSEATGLKDNIRIWFLITGTLLFLLNILMASLESQSLILFFVVAIVLYKLGPSSSDRTFESACGIWEAISQVFASQSSVTVMNLKFELQKLKKGNL